MKCRRREGSKAHATAWRCRAGRCSYSGLKPAAGASVGAGLQRHVTAAAVASAAEAGNECCILQGRRWPTAGCTTGKCCVAARGSQTETRRSPGQPPKRSRPSARGQAAVPARLRRPECGWPTASGWERVAGGRLCRQPLQLRCLHPLQLCLQRIVQALLCSITTKFKHVRVFSRVQRQQRSFNASKCESMHVQSSNAPC